MPNYLNSLIAKVGDSSLRDELHDEVSRLRDRKDFGLIFERHLPETATLFTHPVRPGVRVREREGKEIWTVEEITDSQAKLSRREEDEKLTATLPVEDLVVVREFGEPIYPGLRSVGKVSKGGKKPSSAVINGENYHALETLLYTCEEQVDCIYIDPPYNSGARDWTYNNDYVEESDAYRHSKWLSYMERRLRLARRLLKESSVLVVTIDENEVTRLGVLLQQLFPEALVTLVTIVNNPKGVTRATLSRVEEYAYFCFFGDATVSSIGDDLLTAGADEIEDGAEQRPRWKGLLRSGSNAKREQHPTFFYPIFIDPERAAVIGAGEPLPLETDPDPDKKHEGHFSVWPVRSDGSWGRWMLKPQTLRDWAEKGYVKLGNFDPKRKTWGLSYLTTEPQEQIASGVLEIRSYDSERNVVDAVYAPASAPSRRVKTVWHRTTHDAGVGGTAVVSGLVGDRVFTFPKSVFAVRDTLEMLTADNKSALIVDFFAGSGSTLHAAAMLNAEDGGQRRTILVTNNEVESDEQKSLRGEGHRPGDPEWEKQGIFYRATVPRIQAAITGVRPDGEAIDSKLRNSNGSPMSEGLDENVEFFELVFLDRDEANLGRGFGAIAPLLYLKSGSLGSAISELTSPWALTEDGPYGILFDPEHWRPFVDAIQGRQDVTHAFVVTESLAVFQRVVQELPPNIDTSMLYEDYITSFEINSGADR